MTKVLLTVVLLSYSLNIPAQPANTDDHDIIVIIPPELDPPHPQTEDQRKINDLIRKINANLPYRGDLSKKIFSLGSLCKVSDAVIIGKIVQSDVSASDKSVKNFKIDIETNVFGRTGRTPILIDSAFLNAEVVTPRMEPESAWRLSSQEFNLGKRVIVFLSSDNVSISNIDNWNFDVPPVSSNVSERLRLRGNDRGVVVVNSSEEEKAYIDAVLGYMRCLRGKKKDFEKYYQFLCEQMKSPYFRIKEDARQDMLNLIISYRDIDLDRIIKDDNIDDGIKDYVRLGLKPWREKKKIP